MNKKGIIITILTSLITALLIGSISAYATSYLYNSSEVSYDNASSNITSDNVQGAIDELYTQATNYTDLNSRLNPVGTVIYSTTCDTMAKVVSTYGGTTWIQHSGYFLYGATSNVTANNNVSNGGAATHTLVLNELPGRAVVAISNTTGTTKNVSNAGWGANNISNGGFTATSMQDAKSVNIGTSQGITQAGDKPISMIPPYKNVYIWERTQ